MLDLTGLPIHQWLGLGVGLLAGYHLMAHWSWVKSVSSRLVSTASGQARRYYLVDAGLFAGLSLILVTALAMSTWFDLALEPYHSWYDLHVIATITTLALTVVKVGQCYRRCSYPGHCRRYRDSNGNGRCDLGECA